MGKLPSVCLVEQGELAATAAVKMLSSDTIDHKIFNGGADVFEVYVVLGNGCCAGDMMERAMTVVDTALAKWMSETGTAVWDNGVLVEADQ